MLPIKQQMLIHTLEGRAGRPWQPQTQGANQVPHLRSVELQCANLSLQECRPSQLAQYPVISLLRLSPEVPKSLKGACRGKALGAAARETEQKPGRAPAHRAGWPWQQLSPGTCPRWSATPPWPSPWAPPTAHTQLCVHQGHEHGRKGLSSWSHSHWLPCAAEESQVKGPGSCRLCPHPWRHSMLMHSSQTYPVLLKS